MMANFDADRRQAGSRLELLEQRGPMRQEHVGLDSHGRGKLLDS